ncbi:MAG: hypothetical protein H0T42_30770 [Deltaproteobacteria bacterium]|nr:hypothetical protein [Deltaproteobacteria bacterium]
MRTYAAIVLAVAAGCGDNLSPASETCEPAPGPVPAQGPFADPLALPLPEDCVIGGLRDLPGRWFLRAPEELFDFGYPLFEGSCTTGFRRANWIEEDLDTSDNSAFQTWSDGTRIYTRSYFVFEAPMGLFEFAEVSAVCMMPDGTLAGVSGTYDTDRGEQLTDLIGTRFAPRDTGARGLALVGEIGALTVAAFNVAVDGTYAYVVGPTGLEVIDVADPAEPMIVGHVMGDFNDVKIVRGGGKVVAYAAPSRSRDGTAIIDVTIPDAPAFVGTVPEYSHSVFVTATPPRLYLATYTSTVPVYDVTVPLSPVRLGGVPIIGTEAAGIHDIHVQGDRIYADKTTDGVVAVDVSAGLTQPVELGRLPTSYSHATWAGVAGGRQIAIHGDEGMTPEGGAFMRVLDADRASPTFMKEIGRYQSRTDVGIHNIQLVGDRAYIAYYQDGVRVVDLANPTQPREIAHFNTWDTAIGSGHPFEGALGITVVGDLIYVADSNRGLVILRATL